MRFISGCTITALLIFTPAWWELGVLVIGISTFWKPLSRLAHQVWQDWEMRRLERSAAATLHLDCRAELAWRYFVGERE